MESREEILNNHLCEQIALEEELCRVIMAQISEIDGADFADAKNLLTKTTEVLEKHFVRLNELLDRREQDSLIARTVAVSGNGGGFNNSHDQEQKKRQISRILRDDYSALNLITMSNTLLHTTALALDAPEIAKIAIDHLENLAPIVVRIGELVPEVITRELRTIAPKIDLSVAKTALKNTQLAWRCNDV